MSDPSESHFELDTAVRPGEGGWVADLQDRWNIGEQLNGGYLLAVVTRALLNESGRTDPITVTAHYLGPSAAGPATVSTATVKQGRSFTTVTGSLVQDGRERIRAIGAFGELAGRTGPSRISAHPPEIPPPDDCIPIADVMRRQGHDVHGIQNRFDLRLPPDSPWVGPGEDDPYEITGWIRFRDGTEPSSLSAVAFADASPTLIGSVETGWVPTVELTVHVRGLPAPGWLLGTFRTRVLVNGLMEEDGELWDSEGRPVALSRQLAIVLGT